MLSKYLRQLCTRKLIVQCLHWSPHSHLFKEKLPTCLLPWSVWTFQERLSVCAILTHGPQTTLYRTIMYNFVWIYLCQHCTKILPVQCWPMANRQILWAKPHTFLYRPFWNNIAWKYCLFNVVQTCLRQHCSRKLLKIGHRHLFSHKNQF